MHRVAACGPPKNNSTPGDQIGIIRFVHCSNAVSAAHNEHREPGRFYGHTAKALLPSGVDFLITALAQSFCAE
jgi:hypothetical protein